MPCVEGGAVVVVVGATVVVVVGATVVGVVGGVVVAVVDPPLVDPELDPEPEPDVVDVEPLEEEPLDVAVDPDPEDDPGDVAPDVEVVAPREVEPPDVFEVTPLVEPVVAPLPLTALDASADAAELALCTVALSDATTR